jgi:hypothetical protein
LNGVGFVKLVVVIDEIRNPCQQERGYVAEGLPKDFLDRHLLSRVVPKSSLDWSLDAELSAIPRASEVLGIECISENFVQLKAHGRCSGVV